MAPQDDPEARIGELERPLAEAARTSELSGSRPGSETFTPTAAPVGYGAPFPSTPPKSTAGLRGWWVVLAVFALGAVAVVAGLAAFRAHMFSNAGSIIGSPYYAPEHLSRQHLHD